MVICPPLYVVILDDLRDLGKATWKEERCLRRNESLKENNEQKKICRTKQTLRQ